MFLIGTFINYISIVVVLNDDITCFCILLLHYARALQIFCLWFFILPFFTKSFFICSWILMSCLTVNQLLIHLCGSSAKYSFYVCLEYYRVYMNICVCVWFNILIFPPIVSMAFYHIKFAQHLSTSNSVSAVDWVLIFSIFFFCGHVRMKNIDIYHHIILYCIHLSGKMLAKICERACSTMM